MDIPGLPKHAGAAPIDLRSDTVTRPTPAMYERMRTAELGDDGLEGDPTARALEELAARKLGKEAGLFVPSATMGNLLAVLSQTRREGRVLAEATAHLLTTEGGGATLAGVPYEGIPGTEGAMSLERLDEALRRPGAPHAALVCLETTHGNAAGAVLPLAHMCAVHEAAHAAGAQVHLDGARLFNAAVALGVPADALACWSDTVVVCLSKGLSAPAGAVLAGPAATIARARQLRKTLGGTQRQIGILAAAGLEAIETMVPRLAEDHALAQRLSAGLNAIGSASLRATVPATNIVFAELASGGPGSPDSAAWTAALQQAGVLVRPRAARRLRLVTHRHLDNFAIDQAVAAFRAVLATLEPTTGAPQ